MLFEQNEPFSVRSVLKMGISLLNSLSLIHDAGYIYNDLKLDNLVVGEAYGSENKLDRIRIIDYGLARKYLDSNGDHLDE